MKVAVLGLWHLGSVTAACTAAAGHDVTGWDPDPTTVEGLQNGRPPVAEPGLADLVGEQLRLGRLRFVPDLESAVPSADVVWLAFDTPVDDDDRADVEAVLVHARRALPLMKDGAVFLSSSQLPVGTLRRLEEEWASSGTKRSLDVACSPENLRLGKAIDVFTNPDRIIIGCRSSEARRTLAALFAPISGKLEWMSVESAEMTKHAINAFLATSVAFINEVAVLCEHLGADAKEVERGLKTESRIGPRAYLGPGGAVAGGTLARDISYLRQLGQRLDLPTALLNGVEQSNTNHRAWARRALAGRLGVLRGAQVAVWGLTYKPGTDTLRRSESVELCRWLAGQGALVKAFDPAVRTTTADLESMLTLADDPLAALAGASALVVATEWPEFRAVAADEIVHRMTRPLVLDANRFLAGTVGAASGFEYLTVGRAQG